MGYRITEDCSKCGAYAEECMQKAIEWDGENYIIDSASCIDCGDCTYACPFDAIVDN